MLSVVGLLDTLSVALSHSIVLPLKGMAGLDTCSLGILDSEWLSRLELAGLGVTLVIDTVSTHSLIPLVDGLGTCLVKIAGPMGCSILEEDGQPSISVPTGVSADSPMPTFAGLRHASGMVFSFVILPMWNLDGITVPLRRL